MMSNTDHAGGPYLTVKQAAFRLKLKPNTLDKWRQEGRGPAFRYHGRRIVYHLNDLDEWSSEGKRQQARKYQKKSKNAPENPNKGRGS